jgi:enterochelin esterase-like enzyme
VPAASGKIAPVPLLVVFDGEVWFEEAGLPAALAAARRAGRLPPLAVLGIGNGRREDRRRFLGGHPAMLRAVAHRAVPWALKALAEHGVPAPGTGGRIIAGQSLGGLAALAAATETPGTFDAVIAQSPSMWWRPEGWRGIAGTPTPRDLHSAVPAWITERFTTAGTAAGSGIAGQARIRLQVGTLEGLTIGRMETLRHRLAGDGWDVRMRGYEGGHDYAWWRGALLDALEELTAEPEDRRS